MSRGGPLTLVDALEAPDLFAPLFPSPSWDAWRTFSRALVAAPLSGIDLETFRACTGRQDAPTTPATEAWVIAGRRSGKSRFAALLATHTAALAPVDKLAPGEVGTVLVCAPTREQAKTVYGYLRALFDLPALRPLILEETADSLTLRHRVRIEVRSSNFRSVRGVTLLAAVLDEVAFLRDEASAVPDLELYRALRPALATTGGLILGISSPWAQRGLLWAKYKKHWAQDGPVLVWQAPTTKMHPGLPVELIEDAREDDPEAATAEWDAAFRADLESYVATATLEACTTPGVVERPPTVGRSYVVFIDAATGSGRDSFTAAIAHLEPREDGAPFVVLDAVREIRPPFDPLAGCAEMALFLRTYGVTRATSDRLAGGFVVEAFSRHGIAVAQDADPKSVLYLDVLPLFSAGRVDLLDLPRLRHQLVALERRRRAGGRDVVDHPPAGHDDLANAVVGALVLAQRTLGVGEIRAVNLALEPHRRVDWDQVRYEVF